MLFYADNLGRKPASLDHMHAAALPAAALTAWDALFEVGGLVAGQKVLIHAAAGGVGHIAVHSICAHPAPGPEAARRGLRGAYGGSQPGHDVLNRIAELVDEGKLRPDVSTILPLREARQAHELIQTGHTRGKIVLRVKDG